MAEVAIIDSDELKINCKKRVNNNYAEFIEYPTEAKKPKYETNDETPKPNITNPDQSISPKSNEFAPTTSHQHRSPKKRIQLKAREKFIYGNYSQYYGYRNREKDHHDIRLDMLATQSAIFNGADVLDIGCNSGFITTDVAKRLPVRSIIGIDIDRGLINQANKTLLRLKKAEPPKTSRGGQRRKDFPFNISFTHGNYVLQDDVLLEIEREQFNVILCLSVTKWIHLNFGDAGLRQAFRRMFLQLRPGGRLILEAQPFDNYGRRKKMTETIFGHYKAMQFFPKDFTSYLLSPAVGFAHMELLGVPAHAAAGFKRPIQIFTK